MASSGRGLSSSSSGNSLHIGDTVLFMIKNGFVYSELSGSAYNFMTVLPDSQFSNISYASFKVLAPNKYKARQNLRELEQRKSEDYEILNAKRALEVEDSENELEQTRRFGTRVLYGDHIQLQHVASKKFVKVCSEASKIESNNLLINLSTENAEGCIFKVLPRYKVRSEGDEVRFGDQLKIESVKTQGQFLHCSNRTLGESAARYKVLTNCFELNLSASESALTVISHYTPSTSKYPDKTLRAGNCVRLFHKEDECYIVAEGSFAEDNPVIEDVHCRMRRVDSRKHAAPSTSANTYWQIEKQEDPRSGEMIAWGDRCRLRHLPTRRYLAVIREPGSEEWKVTLREKTPQNELETIFSFSPLIEEGEEVLMESYALIRHRLSGQWLHLEKKNHYIRHSFDPEAKGLAGLQWDSAELFMLTTSKDKGDYDSFTLQEVTEEETDRFNYVAGVVPVLTGYIKEVSEGGDLRQSQGIRVRDTLRDLKKWLVTDKERDTKNNQKLLRNLRVLEQLAEILKSVDASADDRSKHFVVEIGRECYNVIQKFLEGDSRKNENYLARFIEFFQTQMRKGLNAEEVLVEIVQDNLTIVSTMADTQMTHMIEEFITTEDPRFLHFLSSLCVCADRPIPSTQDRLLHELILARGKDIFLRTKISKNAENEDRLYVCEPGKEAPIPMSKINPSINRRMTSVGRRQTAEKKQDKNLFELLEAQLHLLAKLCKGNNKAAINTLVYSEENTDGYISFNEALLCVQDSSIDTTIRSCYVQLILVMFVDVGDNRSFLDNLCYSFIYDELSSTPYDDTGDEETIALTGVENIHFPALKKWILNTLTEKSTLLCDDDHTKQNEFLIHVLEVLRYLVSYGYYDDIDDVNETMIPLIQLLDGTTDLPCQPNQASNTEMTEFINVFKTIGRKKDSSENKPAFEVKCKALEVMELFYRFKFYVKLQKFMHDFKVMNKSGTRRRVDSRARLDTNEPPFVLARFIEAEHNDPQDWIVAPHTINIARDRIKYLCDGSDRGGGFVPQDDSIPLLETVLLDLSEYECDELVTASLDLLTQMYFFEEELFNKAHQGQLLTSPDSLRDYKVVKDEILPELRQLLRVDTNRENQDRIVYLLQSLTSLLSLPNSNEPNKQNQLMLDNFGIVSELVSFILTKGDHDSQIEIGGNSVSVSEEVFRECFSLLRFIATDNFSVQKRLFNRIDDLLEIKVPVPVLADLANLMTEVFTGGPELILKVTESHVEKIYELMIDSENATVQAQFMVTLEAMAKIEELNLPVARNQAHIVKNFCRLNRNGFCHIVLGEDKDMESQRMAVLEKEETVPLDPQVQLLLSVTDMLAACAEGKHRFIESVCQNILTVDELIKIITSDHLPPSYKRPFLRFLIFVYMITEEDHTKQGSSLSHGDTIWSYLKHLAVLLESVASVLDGVSTGDLDELRFEMNTSNRRRATFSSSQAPNKLARFKSVNTQPGVTDEFGQLQNGLLEYIADGVIPLLHSYYSSFFDPSGLSKETERKKEFDISTNITQSLMHLSKELLKVFTSENHIQMFQDTLNILLNYDEIKEEVDSDNTKTQQVQEAFNIALKVTDRRQSRRRGLNKTATFDIAMEDDEELNEKMEKQYAEQQKLNDLFNNYSRNYHYSYMGPNTASHQISSPVHEIEYSDEGEELPLGPSFQRLVKLYIDSTTTQDKKVAQHAERLLCQLEISHSRTEQLGEAEQVRQNILDVRCLQVLRALIHNETKLIDPELKDRDPIKFREQSDDLVVPVQNRIQSLDNAIRRIIPLLSHPDESISREALALMKALLFSGNETVQEGVAESVQETREEILFLTLKERLEIASLNYRETVDLEAQLNFRLQKEKEIKAKHQQDYPPSEPGEPTVNFYKDKRVSFARRTSDNVYSTGKEVAIAMDVLNKPDDDDQPLLKTVVSSGSLYRNRGITFSEPDLLDCKSQENEKETKLLSQLMSSDTHWTSLVLEVIGLMCDGQNRTLQHYLREQSDNFKTVNVVAEVTTFLHTYTAGFSRENMGQIARILQALIEMCVGNVQNQQVIFDKLVVDPLNRILQLPLDNIHRECHFEETAVQKCPSCAYIIDLIQVKGSAIELLDVMLEETSQETLPIAKGIGSSLDVDAVLDTMNLFYELQSHPLVRRQQMDDDCQRSLSKAYHTLVTLTDYEAIDIKSKKELRKRGEKKCKEAFNAATQHSHAIEIHYEEEGSKPILAKVHFPCKETLREEVTELVRWNINRDSMEDKQRALVDLMPALKRDVRHQTRLKDTKIMKPFLAFHKLRSRLLLLLTIILNLFILFLYVVPEEDRETNSIFLPATPDWFNLLIFIFGAVHLFMTVWIVVEYFVINWPHFRLPAFVYSLRAKLENTLRKDGSTYTVPHLTCIDVGIFSVSTLYMILFLFCSILSLAFRGYFYCFCLLFIIVDNDILKRVLRAVTKNGISLIWVAILGIIVLFIYAVLSFAFFQSNFIESSGLYCDNLGECSYSVLRFGLTDNIGFAIPFRNSSIVSDFNAGALTARLIFGLSFFIIVSTIGLNIVFGIIVDSFSELREERSNIEAEQKSKCFICDLPSYDFERRAKGFVYHIKHDHNMWDYIYYSLYLDSIDTGDHNAIQKYVYELIADNDTGFFPQEEARCLVGEEDTTGEKIDELQERVENILQHFREKDRTKNVKAKKLAQKNWEEQIRRERPFSQSSFDRYRMTPQMSIDPQASLGGAPQMSPSY